MSHEELKELKVQVEELLAKGYIQPSKSPYGAPVFFVHKDRTLRMWVDYRAFNKAMVKNRYPCFESMIYLIVFQEPRCLVGLIHVQGITKFGLWKGTKKNCLSHKVWLI
jgi:hypothetical protein